MDIEDVHVEAVAVQKSPDESITIHKDRKNVITKLPRAEAGSHVPGKERFGCWRDGSEFFL
jgi:hypothetical protein